MLDMLECAFLCGNTVGVKGAGSGGGLDVWGGDELGSDIAVGCLVEVLLWSFSDSSLIVNCFVMMEPCD